MEKEKVDGLVKNLGLQHELAPLLDFEEDYIRFENVISRILDKLEKRKTHVIRTGYYIGDRYSKGQSQKVLRMVFRGITQFEEAVDCFRKYWGVLCPRQSYAEISKEFGISSLERSGRQTVSYRCNFVLNVLKQYHKADIWYGVL